MRRVTLARAWNPGTGVLLRGSSVEVEDAMAEWLEAQGALASEVVSKPSGPVVTRAAKPKPAPVEKVVEGPSAPKRTESLDVWRAYAVKKGIDPKGLTKKEIIAATR
jgi:hypothetical protein